MAKRVVRVPRPDGPMSISVRHARHPSIAAGRSYSGSPAAQAISPAVSDTGVNHGKTRLMPAPLCLLTEAWPAAR
ncbi:msl7183 [Mesorhizobium japonicum MAFF 303099]|uniref:Msl7183 protein n=1 Tax=Mesorhizobium japonicum (strain LMG 29417 / CECT 9101 / MAFF 303099) TaxID=266835 RepID=Q986W3_RHILO|nr:msl7183 [Mesorhizobium japonicum MAFF 303099]